MCGPAGKLQTRCHFSNNKKMNLNLNLCLCRSFVLYC